MAGTTRSRITFPMPPIGANNDPLEVIRSCPSRRYHACFLEEIRLRYPVTVFKKRHRPYRCYEPFADLSSSDCRELSPEEVPVMDMSSRHSVPLGRCQITARQPPRSLAAHGRLRCDSNATAVNNRALMLIGVPSSPNAKGRKRRDAIRAAWMQDASIATGDAVVCFLLSAETPQPMLSALQAELSTYGDLLLIDAPETPWLIRSATRYSNGTRRGRGMPTFKQHRFFQIAAMRWPRVPFIAKFDDDTAPNLRLLVPLLRRLLVSCEPYLFIGAINWAGVVPRAVAEGVRLDRCGFAWDLNGALSNFGQSWGTPGKLRGPGKHIEACDKRGAVLPVPCTEPPLEAPRRPTYVFRARDRCPAPPTLPLLTAP